LHLRVLEDPVSDSFTWNSFAGGWQPNADSVNAPQGCLLQMDNLELDKTGALSLMGGTALVGSAYAANAHTIVSNILNGVRYDYVADISGRIFRNGVSIGIGGSSTNAAFSVAYDLVLACSGTTRLKDTGTSTSNLGIAGATSIGLAEIDGYVSTQGAYLNNPSAFVGVLGSWTQDGTSFYFTVDPTSLNAVVQTYTYTYPSIPMDMTVLTAFNSLSQSIPGLTFSAFDTLNLELFFEYIAASNPSGSSSIGNITDIVSIELDILLVAPDSSGDVVSDYFSFIWTNSSSGIVTNSSGIFYGNTSIIGSSDLQIPIQRGQFTRIGGGNQDWSTVYGFRITVSASSALANVVVLMPTEFIGATLNGSYQYAQINVNQSDAYTAMSAFDGASGALTVTNKTVQVLPYLVGLDPQVNQIWIYRIGGNLEQWYRVLVFTSANWTVPQYDAMSDAAAQTIDLTINLNLVSINSIGILDSIYDIVGPIEGRWFYFTSQFMYPSDINDPDLVDVTLGVRTCGQAELYLWARRISYNSVIVGTSRDCYLLTGTFVTLPDGTVDIYYQSLGCKYPPISFDATFSSGQVFYLAADGWRSIDGSGNCVNITVPTTDRLYRGISAYGYSVDVQITPGSVRFPVVLARNKLWCSITGQSRMEVLDSSRGYWRNFTIGKGDCLAICSTQDGGILGFFASDKKLRLLDQQASLQIDGITNQTVTVLSPVFDGGTPKQRKDAYTLNVRANTGGQPLYIFLVDDTGTSYSIGSITTTSLVESIVDVSDTISLLKTFQFGFYGTFSNLTIDDITFYFDTRPTQLTHVHLLPENFGTTGRKRIPTIPFVIDTLGKNGTFTPILDGVVQTALTINSTWKKSFDYKAALDAIGVDWEFVVDGGGWPFEFFGIQKPQYMEKFPEPIKFYTIPVTNFGTMARKHLRKWRFVLDPLGGTVTFTPIIDGSSGPTSTYSFTGKTTVAYYFTADQIGTDFSGTLSSSTAFELWDILKPDADDIEALPDAVEYRLILPDNFGSSSRKHIRKFSFMLDPLGNNVVFTPIVDGASLSTTTFTGTGKETFVRYFTVDELGVDWGGTLVGNGPFEVYNIIPPTKDEIDILPEQVKYFLLKPSNLGSPGRKRINDISFVLDTLGNNVVFTPIIDGSSGTPTTFSGSNGKQTFFHYFTTDTIGVDWGGTLTGGPFEIYEIGQFN
jgi:hypothetical protein